MSEEFRITWDFTRERLIQDGLLWLLPHDDPMHPLYGMTKHERRRWRRSARRGMQVKEVRVWQ